MLKSFNAHPVFAGAILLLASGPLCAGDLVTIMAGEVRDGPSAAARKIETLPVGTRLIEVSRSNNQAWVQVARNGKTIGFVAVGQVRAENSARQSSAAGLDGLLIGAQAEANQAKEARLQQAERDRLAAEERRRQEVEAEAAKEAAFRARRARYNAELAEMLADNDDGTNDGNRIMMNSLNRIQSNTQRSLQQIEQSNRLAQQAERRQQQLEQERRRDDQDRARRQADANIAAQRAHCTSSGGAWTSERCTLTPSGSLRSGIGRGIGTASPVPDTASTAIAGYVPPPARYQLPSAPAPVVAKPPATAREPEKIQMIEALAYCYDLSKSSGGGKTGWICDGPTQRLSVSEPSLARALELSGCQRPDPYSRANGYKDGNIHFCEIGLQSYHVDISKKYPLTSGILTSRERYTCLKNNTTGCGRGNALGIVQGAGW
ncbi:MULTISPECIES: SH3 domain-containing protein [Azospirillum]|uniref:SH3 domain-containing protein n=1 Tax=Azospirillum brasilense TaxID=192 RepID=A0ABU4PIF6_AZOBR|nr:MULTISPECIES: SH3 domain-containing protein [Azospirillum]MDX5955876.1 SH3 domain-containing protein [Azospirillum brasilense]